MENQHMTDAKNYEYDFLKKIGLSFLIFLVIALLSAFSVQLILSVEIFPTSTKLDAQTLGNFFIFAFATSVAFAGALVVIKIAAKQEDLAKNQLDLAQRQELLAKTQLEFAKKATQEYQVASTTGDRVALAMQSLTQKINLVFGFYYEAHFKDKSLSSKESLILGSRDVLRRITVTLQEPWVLELTQYEIESKRLSPESQASESQANVLILFANKFCFESFKLLSILESRRFASEDDRSKEASDILRSLNTGVTKFYEQLNEIRGNYQLRIEKGELLSFTADNPVITASIHQKLMRLELKPDLRIL